MSKFDEIKLGAFARDRICKFKGVVAGKGRHINGCHRITIMPQDLKDGKPQKALTMDVQQVELTGGGIERNVPDADWGAMRNGVTVRERITGLVGVVVCLTEWFSGKLRVTVQPTEHKPGTEFDLFDLDLNDVEITDARHIFGEEEEHRVETSPVPGGPCHEPVNA